VDAEALNRGSDGYDPHVVVFCGTNAVREVLNLAQVVRVDGTVGRKHGRGACSVVTVDAREIRVEQLRDLD
jgi:hypothetical protein